MKPETIAHAKAGAEFIAGNRRKQDERRKDLARTLAAHPKLVQAIRNRIEHYRSAADYEAAFGIVADDLTRILEATTP